MPMIAVQDGIRLHVQDIGTGPAVVFIAGFGLDHTLWDRQVRVLAAAGVRTVCVTQRGHGASDHPLTGYGIDRLSADLLAVLDTLELATASVVGHSFGGFVGFHTAACAPDRIDRLALVSSNGVRASRSAEFPFGPPAEAAVAKMIDDEHHDRIPARYRQIESSFGATPDPRTVDWLMRTFLAMPSWAAIECYRTLLCTDLTDDLPLVHQPVLQVTGSCDPVQSLGAAQWLHERLPDATLVQVDGGHFPMLEAPEVLDQALLAFTAPSPGR